MADTAVTFDEDPFEDEKTEVTKLMDTFRAEVSRTKASMEGVSRKANLAALTAKRKGSAQRLRAISEHPPSTDSPEEGEDTRPDIKPVGDILRAEE